MKKIQGKKKGSRHKMNLIKLLDYIDIDSLIPTVPLQLLLFKEIHLEKEYARSYWGGYETVFNKEALNRYFQDELTYDEILKAKDLSSFELPFKVEFIPLIKERLEEIKALPDPVFNEEKMTILKAIIDSSNEFISLSYITKSIHKNELLTLLAVTEWEFWLQSVFGWGLDYLSIGFKFTNIFDIDELEVYLPYEEIKNLMDKLPPKYHMEYQKLINNNEEVFNRLSKFKTTETLLDDVNLLKD